MLTLVSFNDAENKYVLMNLLTGAYCSCTKEMSALICESVRDGQHIRNLNVYISDKGGYDMSITGGITGNLKLPYAREDFLPKEISKSWLTG